ncbi:MAG TPA: SusD/RagB family nutrient-binding outer membrane lipoprotein, partial [Phnomibacter sp.]|nr:SusD/RagB family nutrient-binding outer membrane lipoprotein [Phnomibacter sp.]
MKNIIKTTTLIAASALLLTACKKHEDFQENPNSPSTALPSLLLTNISISTFNPWPLDAAYASRHLTFYERPSVFIQYNWNRGSFGAFDVLRQVNDMERLARATNETNYLGVAKFFRAVHFLQLTETFGDIPYSEAMKATEGIAQPKYDTQEQIYAGILKELDEANDLLDPSKPSLGGDIIFGKTPNQATQRWKQLVNAFRLRVLIHLSKKENNNLLNVKSQFSQIISNPTKYPLMKSNADNAQLAYNTSSTTNAYPTFQNLSVQTSISLEKRF